VICGIQADRFAPPPALNMEATNLKEEWEMFEQGFDLFITATDSSDKPEPTRVAMFLSAIGAEARRVYNSFTFATEADKKKLDKVKDKFRDYCTLRKKEVFELSQAYSESIDSSAAALRLQLRCFGNQTESLLTLLKAMRHSSVNTTPYLRLANF